MRSRMSIASLAVGVAAALAPIATATPAQAASVATWDRLAQCESGGRWHINTGNGFYGGLQFTRSTWISFGGKRFAPMAHKATRLEQIKVAERVKRVQGWRAWPACTAKLGLR
jgi:resuscitation-promoting factor RpfA